MAVCDTLDVRTIFDNECLSDSLTKINNNFLNLQTALCDIKAKADVRVEVRTFFYYGPNGDTNPGDGMQDNQTSRPSDLTIQAFVNSPTQLSLPSFSKPGDIAYVIYQKTGFLNNQLAGINTDYTFGNVTVDIFNNFAPVFIIWKLTSNPKNIYLVDSGFPKFTRAQTSNTTASLNPQTWGMF